MRFHGLRQMLLYVYNIYPPVTVFVNFTCWSVRIPSRSLTVVHFQKGIERRGESSMQRHMQNAWV